MAKTPGRVGVKTRLAPVLAPEARSRLARALLDDRIEQLTRIPGLDPHLAHTGTPPPQAAPASPPIPGFPQRGEGLGARLIHAAATLFARGYGRVMLVDADSPLVPDQTFVAATVALERVDVVVGPSDDGGYYLIGMRTPQPSLFRDVPFSTAEVLTVTRSRAREAGLETYLLPATYDIDEPADLERLRMDLADGPARWPRADGGETKAEGAPHPRHLTAWLQAWGDGSVTSRVVR
ncbi:MAG: TIGR04282 family arsenosugar biosynthesis glycosyltransferase [Myxococcota bacterium]